MRSIFIIILVICFGSCKNSGNPPEEQMPIAEQITEEEALNLLHEWTAAYLSGDVAPLNDILDESWVYSGSANGQVSDKASAIDEFSKADYKFHDISYQELDVRLYEDIAVVRGSEKMVIVGSSGIDTTRLSLRFTDVYQKKDGKIRAIATHSSPIAEE